MIDNKDGLCISGQVALERWGKYNIDHISGYSPENILYKMRHGSGHFPRVGEKPAPKDVEQTEVALIRLGKKSLFVARCLIIRYTEFQKGERQLARQMDISYNEFREKVKIGNYMIGLMLSIW